MAELGHRAIALDLPGFGASPMPPWEISIPRYGDVVGEFCSRLDVGHCTLVGNSMGGFVAAEVAVGEPEWVDRMVLVSAAGISHATMRREPVVAGARLSLVANPLLFRLDVGSARRPGLRKLMFGGVMRHPDQIRPELLSEFLAPALGAEGFIPAVAALTGYDLTDRLERVRVPTLVVWGRDDLVVPASDAAGFVEGSRTPSSSSSPTAATCRWPSGRCGSTACSSPSSRRTERGPAGAQRPMAERAIESIACGVRRREPDEGVPERGGGLGAVHPGPVSGEQVLGLEVAEAVRREHSQHRVDADGLAAGAEVAGGPDRLRHDQRPIGRRPDRDLVPELVADHRDGLESRSLHAVEGKPMVRDAEALGELGGVAVMAIEELQHAGRVPDREDPRVEPGDVGRVDDPDLAVEAHRMAGALHRLGGVDEPGEAELVLLEERLPHQEVIAPSEALETDFAYLAITPLGKAGSGGS